MNKIQSPIANQTSWNKVSRWYGNLVSQKGHYFHQNVVMPKSISLLALTSDASVLDLACGPGILARYLPKSVTYAGIDASINLINMAKKMDHNSHHEYFVGDVSKILPVKKNDFTHVTIILALQNIKEA